MTLATKVQERFIDFVNSYLTDEGDNSGYLAKREHTIRVTQNAIWIANDYQLDDETKLIIELSAILHDVGRFEEWKKFHSYAKTGFDHPREGAKMLENGLIKEMIPETRQYDDIIILAVREHGALKIVDGLSERDKLICEIIRDADRIDIFYQISQEEHFDRMYNYPLGERRISEYVREKFINGEPIPKAEIKSKLDVLTLEFDLIKQLTTDGAKRYVKEMDLPNKMVDIFKRRLLPHYDEDEIEWLRKEINTYLA